MHEPGSAPRGHHRHSWPAPLVPGLLSLAGAVLVVALSLVHDHGDLSRFVMAGRSFVEPRPQLHVQPGAGYDGQFVYRLALAPFDLARRAHGITLDMGLRAQRIGLPVLGWLASAGGQPQLLPAALVGVNTAALTAVGALGGLAARQAGRRPAWGVLLASPVGLAYALERDLTEVVEISLLLAGLLLLRAARPVSAGAALAGAALTRETALLTVAAIALPRLVTLARRDTRPGRADLAWVLPGVAFAGWQLAVAAATGSLPLHNDTGANLGLPGVGLSQLVRDLPQASERQLLLLTAQVAVLVYLLVAAAPHLRRATPPVPLAWVVSGLFSLCLARFVWEGYDDLRFLVDLSELTLLALLAAPRRLTDVAALSAGVWVLTLVFQVT